MNLGLKGRVAFVTGSSAGLGMAAARALLAEGCRVGICSRDRGRIDEAAWRLRHETGASEDEVLPIECDVTDEAAIHDAVNLIVERFGALHVLVTNAGGPPSGPISGFKADDFRRAVELNLISTINLVERSRPHLEKAARDDGHARVIMVTSLSAKQPLPSLVLSNTARAGVQGFAKSLAKEVGTLGITVNTVLPGYTETERLDDLAEAIQRETGRSPEDTRRDWAEQNVLKRLGTPEEFAAAVVFLASRQAAYVTGVALPVDGGRSQHLL